MAPPNRSSSNSLNDSAVIALLPSFDGSGSKEISHFCEEFSQIINTINLPDEQKCIVLRAKITGKAARTLTNHRHLIIEQNFDKLINQIKKIFQPTKSLTQKQAQFQAIVHTPDMSIRDLAAKIKYLAQEYLELQDTVSPAMESVIEKVALAKFIEVLRVDLKIEVMKKDPQTLEEAVSVAEKNEAIFNETNRFINTVSTQSSNNEQSDLRAELAHCKEQLNKIIDRGNINCLGCGKSGHYLVACPEMSQINNAIPTQGPVSQFHHGNYNNNTYDNGNDNYFNRNTSTLNVNARSFRPRALQTRHNLRPYANNNYRGNFRRNQNMRTRTRPYARHNNNNNNSRYTYSHNNTRKNLN